MDVETRRAFWQTMREFAASGRTVLFATHYLEEADAVADRIIMLNRGRVVADGSATEIKASVSTRVIRFTLPEAVRSTLLTLARCVRTYRSTEPALRFKALTQTRRCAHLRQHRSTGAISK